jgi:hypothetical protein
VHFMRNVLAHAGRQGRRVVAALGVFFGLFSLGANRRAEKTFPTAKTRGIDRLRLVPATAAKTTKGNPASCLTGSPSIGPTRRDYAGVDV